MLGSHSAVSVVRQSGARERRVTVPDRRREVAVRFRCVERVLRGSAVAHSLASRFRGRAVEATAALAVARPVLLVCAIGATAGHGHTTVVRVRLQDGRRSVRGGRDRERTGGR